jgi:hypothetical protein
MSSPARNKPSASKKSTPKPQSIDECLKDYPAKLQALAQDLRELVKTQVPEAKESVNSWGIPTFSLIGSFAFFLIAKSHLSLGFALGTSLQDPHHLLEGTGKNLRHVKIRTPEDLSQPGLAELIIDAARLDRETPPEKRRSRM